MSGVGGGVWPLKLHRALRNILLRKAAVLPPRHRAPGCRMGVTPGTESRLARRWLRRGSGLWDEAERPQGWAGGPATSRAAPASLRQSVRLPWRGRPAHGGVPDRTDPLHGRGRAGGRRCQAGLSSHPRRCTRFPVSSDSLVCLLPAHCLVREELNVTLSSLVFRV